MSSRRRSFFAKVFACVDLFGPKFCLSISGRSQEDLYKYDVYIYALSLALSLSLSLSLSLLKSEGHFVPRCQEFPLWSCVCVQDEYCKYRGCLSNVWGNAGKEESYKITSFYYASHGITCRLQEETCK